VKHFGWIAVMLLAGFSTFPQRVLAAAVADLDPARQWKTARVEFSGNEKFSADELRDAMVTKTRSWFRFWEDLPPFDPVTFETDLERVRRYYESRGYYEAAVSYDLEIDSARDEVAARISVREGEPVLVGAIDVQVALKTADQKPPVLPDELPVKRGEVFRETEYQQAEQVLRNSLLEAGYAHTQSERRAEVDLAEQRAHIRYGLRPGPITYFGETTIKGLDKVEPELIQREIRYETGEIYSLKKVSETREKLLALELFGTVRVAPAQSQGTPTTLPMEIEVAEKAHREIRLALGYGTEDQFRTQLEWRHLNWLGDGRRLSVLAKYSSIKLSSAINLVQPHLFSRDTEGALQLGYDQEDEETYLRNVARFLPRLNHRFSPALTGFVGYRVEYDKLNDIEAATEAALGDIRRQGVVSGPTAGLVWNTSDDVFNPKKGEVISLTLDQAGAIWGGQFSFFKITAEAKKYIEIGWSTILASRLKIGVADAIGSDKNFPLFERFFAGGEKSVRGYGRRRLGPLTSGDDPLGGLSLIEGSLELRRPIWKELTGAVFLDFGQVSTKAYDLPIDDLQFSTGFGVSYSTPVGPLRFDVGFPFKPPRGDRAWQIHFSIGAYF
jgi:outer membrane protein assembly complex protein YaeT